MRTYTIPFNAAVNARAVEVLTKHYCGALPKFLPMGSSWCARPAAGFPSARNSCSLVWGAAEFDSVTARIDVLTDTLFHETIPQCDGGFTFDPRTLRLANLKAGQYVASIFGCERRFLDRPDFQELRSWVSFVESRLRAPGAYIGGWRNEDNSCLYLDVSRVFDNREEAVRFAQENCQLAIFDVEANSTFPVPPKGQ